MPIRALKGFKRNFIKAGTTKDIAFVLKPEDLMIVTNDGEQKFMSGKLTISAGGCQPDKATALAKQTVAKTVTMM